MQVTTTRLAGVLLIEPRLFGDARGSLFESYHSERYREAGVDVEFVQDNLSRSQPGVLRGLHYQRTELQAKLVQVLEGEVLDVAVDLRPGSPTFGQHVCATLSADNRHQLYLPGGMAHGFCVTGDGPATVLYKCSSHYNPADERGVRWDDPELAIAWPLQAPLLSDRDAALPVLADAELPQQPILSTRQAP